MVVGHPRGWTPGRLRAPARAGAGRDRPRSAWSGGRPGSHPDVREQLGQRPPVELAQDGEWAARRRTRCTPAPCRTPAGTRSGRRARRPRRSPRPRPPPRPAPRAPRRAPRRPRRRRTAGWVRSASSTSMGPSFSPPRLITSESRPDRNRKPSSSCHPVSPVASQSAVVFCAAAHPELAGLAGDDGSTGRRVHDAQLDSGQGSSDRAEPVAPPVVVGGQRGVGAERLGLPERVGEVDTGQRGHGPADEVGRRRGRAVAQRPQGAEVGRRRTSGGRGSGPASSAPRRSGGPGAVRPVRARCRRRTSAAGPASCPGAGRRTGRGCPRCGRWARTSCRPPGPQSGRWAWSSRPAGRPPRRG